MIRLRGLLAFQLIMTECWGRKHPAGAIVGAKDNLGR
jgi:hypothetical protein